MNPFDTLAAYGFSVFPIARPLKTPALKWKHYQTHRASGAERAEWHAAGHNTGIATGRLSGCIVLDCDNLSALMDAEERGLPHTLRITTPRCVHIVFRHPGGDVPNRAAFLPGMDIRGDGGYVVSHGSHFTPTPEEAAKGKVEGDYLIEQDAPLADVPDWLLPYLQRFMDVPNPPAARVDAETTSAYGLRAMTLELEILADARPGKINDQINASAFAIGQLVGGGEIRTDEALEALHEALCGHGVGDEAHANQALGNGFNAGLEQPRAAPPAPTAEQAFGAREMSAITGDPEIDVPAPPEAFGPSHHPVTVGGGGLVSYFHNCVYVAFDDAMWVPGGVLLKRSAFDGIYGGPRFYLGAENDKPTKSAWEAFRLNETQRMPRAYRTCFRPELTAGGIVHIEGLPHLNAYTPVQVRRVDGDASRFVQHVHRLLPNGDDAELLLHWMASCVQNPGVKFQWWPVIQGVKGNGKSLLLNVMMYAVGSRYSHLVNAEAMQKSGNQFNAWIERKLFLGFEEIHSNGSQRNLVEMMKDTVTNNRIVSEGKGAAQDTVDNRANGMMLTNHDDAVPIDTDERRWGIFWCAQQAFEHLARDGMGLAYFSSLYTWLREQDGFAIVAHYLATRPLSVAMDPARDLQRAPFTSSTQAAIRGSLGTIEQEVLEAIGGDLPGFRGGMMASTAIKHLLQSLRITLGPKRYPALVRALGYVTHPQMTDGRVNNPLTDGSKPRLYFKNSHPALEMTAADAARNYEAAQTATAINNVEALKARP